MVETLYFPHRRYRFHPLLENQEPICHAAWPKNIFFPLIEKKKKCKEGRSSDPIENLTLKFQAVRKAVSNIRLNMPTAPACSLASEFSGALSKYLYGSPKC